MGTAFIHDLTDGFSVSSLLVKDSTGFVTAAVFYTLVAQLGAPELGSASCDRPPIFVQPMN